MAKAQQEGLASLLPSFFQSMHSIRDVITCQCDGPALASTMCCYKVVLSVLDWTVFHELVYIGICNWGGIRSNVLKYLYCKVPGHRWAVPMLGFGRVQQGLQPGGVCSVMISVHIIIP